MYSKLVQRCFDDCITDFTTKSITSREESCTMRCVDKHLKSQERLGQRFQENNVAMQSGQLPWRWCSVRCKKKAPKWCSWTPFEVCWPKHAGSCFGNDMATKPFHPTLTRQGLRMCIDHFYLCPRRHISWEQMHIIFLDDKLSDRCIKYPYVFK